MTTRSPVRVHGVCHVFLAYDVGFGVDLDAAAALLADGSGRGTFVRRRRAPKSIQYEPAPLRFEHQYEPIEVGGLATRSGVECVLFDFGSVSVRYRIPFDVPFEELVALSAALYENESILRSSRDVVERMLDQLSPSIARPSIGPFEEDYVVFQIEGISGPTLEELLRSHAVSLARILRAEPEALSEQQVGDALAFSIAYAPDDLVLVDWMSAVVFDREGEDACTVLEHANVQLLEMQLLDRQLDESLDESYELFQRGGLRGWRHRFLMRSDAAHLGRLAGFQVDSSRMFEGARNALKLVGDDYLARIYGACAERFHLPSWIESIERKLSVLEGIYEKLSDFQTTRRLELLEWIIIVLIALSIVLSLLGK